MLGAAVDRLREWGFLRRFVLRLRYGRSRRVDARLGISTTPEAADRADRKYPEGASAHADSRWYESVDYRQLEMIVRRLRLEPEDVVFDIGCGMGRVVCVVARRSIRAVVGVELDASMSARARANGEALRGRRAEIRIVTGDASAVDYADGTVFILFNPFGAETMKATLERIRESLRQRPREIRLAYINPDCEGEFERCGWLRRVGESRSLWFRHRTIYWRNCSPVGAARARR